jgi:5,10-methylenetetrahydrofolate reductase
MSSRRFLRVVEVFPPGAAGGPSGVGELVSAQKWVSEVWKVVPYADVVMVAELGTRGSRPTTIEPSALLASTLGVRVLPVVSAALTGKGAFSAAVREAISKGIKGIVPVWGDRGKSPKEGGFVGLWEAVTAARDIAMDHGGDFLIMAPANLSKFGRSKHLKLLSSRLENGADYLLAQPPTMDSEEAFALHQKALKDSGLMEKVIPQVFPFKDWEDVKKCRQKFGWEVPGRMAQVAARGEEALLDEAALVARRLRQEGFAGVYLSTRGRPELAARVLR